MLLFNLVLKPFYSHKCKIYATVLAVFFLSCRYGFESKDFHLVMYFLFICTIVVMLLLFNALFTASVFHVTDWSWLYMGCPFENKITKWWLYLVFHILCKLWIQGLLYLPLPSGTFQNWYIYYCCSSISPFYKEVLFTWISQFFSNNDRRAGLSWDNYKWYPVCHVLNISCHWRIWIPCFFSDGYGGIIISYVSEIVMEIQMISACYALRNNLSCEW